jgi:hypothetical protein
MTVISARVIEDSSCIDVTGDRRRLTTLELVYPRWIHAEGRTHRVLKIGEEEEVLEPRTPSPMEDPNMSRNASSSRAIPVKTLIREVMERPAIPMFWGANQKGMQAGANHHARIDRWHQREFGVAPGTMSREEAWLEAMEQAVNAAQAFDAAGYHKQIVNRLIEPYSHIRVVMTGDQWDNFHALRDHEMAEPHIRLLSQRIQAAMNDSTPRLLRAGEWHLPYVTEDERESVANPIWFGGGRKIDPSSPMIPSVIRLSVARCARVSYRTHDGLLPRPLDDFRLYNDLVGQRPLHASPAEHQARGWSLVDSEMPDICGNFKWFAQFRKMIE